MARRVDCNVILKYCEILDEFIKVRVFTEEDIGELMQVKSIPNKQAYQQLVVNACILHYHEEVLPLFKKINRVYKAEALEELLYQICVEVNPHMEIHQVALPIDGQPGSSDQLHLLQANGLGNQKESRKSLTHIHQKLRRAIIGQGEALDTVMRSIRKAAAGLKDPAKPIGVFLLVGQTGTGKTELAKVLSRLVFGDPGKLVRIDCSEYALPHEYAKLIGAPPGYVGHNDGGHLTEAMKDRKGGVVLFDEIEKAHGKVHNLLLQIMDEGFLTDNKGGVVSFAQSLILLTSNVGVDEIKEVRGRMGFGKGGRNEPSNEDLSDATLAAMREAFRPEFINRLSGVVVFNPLSEQNCVRIARNQLKLVASYLKRAGIELKPTPTVCQRLASLGYSAEYGAREIRRTIQTYIEDPLSERILKGDFGPGDTVKIFVRGKKFLFEQRVVGEVVEHPKKRRRRKSRGSDKRPVEPAEPKPDRLIEV